ncbi:hypothetical protein DFS34DRAFT_655071 [Phlyctochytrium arcticum]|nr:hypothetical protein DFS34DRAFT_655071 [Phlyctochytrium arcticum]
MKSPITSFGIQIWEKNYQVTPLHSFTRTCLPGIFAPGRINVFFTAKAARKNSSVVSQVYQGDSQDSEPTRHPNTDLTDVYLPGQIATPALIPALPHLVRPIPYVVWGWTNNGDIPRYSPLEKDAVE